MSRFLSDLMKWVDLLTSEQKKEEQRQKTFGLVRVYANIQIILCLILTYYFSELNPHILFYIFVLNHDIC